MRRFTRLWIPLLIMMALVPAVSLVSAGAAQAAKRPVPALRPAKLTSVPANAKLHAVTTPPLVSNTPPPGGLHLVDFGPTKQQAKALPHRSATSNVIGGGDLTYHGGSVELTPKAYVIFWGSFWAGAPERQVIQQYFGDVSGSAFENLLSIYYGANQMRIANTLTLPITPIIDTTHPLPSGNTACGGPTIEDEMDIIPEIQSELSPSQLGDPNATVYVYTPNGYFVHTNLISGGGCSDTTDSGTKQEYCSLGVYDNSGNPFFYFATLPYTSDATNCQVAQDPNGNFAGDSLVNLTTAQQFQSITNRDLSGWFDNLSFTISQKCTGDFSLGQTVIGSHHYYVQTEYSNAAHACENGFSLTPSEISLNPPAVTMTEPAGVTLTDHAMVSLVNTGQGTMQWTASTGQHSWVSVSPTSGTLAQGAPPQTLTLTFTLSSSAQAQTYATNLSVSDANGANSPVTLPITLIVTNASTTWYFAEGNTNTGFSEFLTLENPTSQPTMATVHYFLSTGSQITANYPVNAHQRTTVTVSNDVTQTNIGVSAVVTAPVPIIAERPMYFNYFGIPGGSDILGATALNTQFDFGYLDTTANHATWLTILNQNSSQMTVTITYFDQQGNVTMVTHPVAANSRGTVSVNGDVPPGIYSALVSLSDGHGNPLQGLVERPMYLIDGSTGFTGSSDVVGVASPQKSWFFAEGNLVFDPTNPNYRFIERYFLANPGGVAAHVNVTFFLTSGAPKMFSYTIQPGNQQVIDAGALLGNNAGANSVQVTSDQPILAERFMSFNLFGIPGATDVLGTSAPGFLFDFAEGNTYSNFSEYLTLENPNPTETANVYVSLFPALSAGPPPVLVQVPPGSRYTVDLKKQLAGQAFSMEVSSNIAIVAERPMYFNFFGNTGGTDVVGYQSVGTPLAPSPSSVYNGSAGGNEYALDAGIGTLRLPNWPVAGSSTIYSGTSIDSSTNTAYFASYGFNSSGSSFGGTLYAVDAHTGAPKWSFTLQAGYDLYTTPVVSNGAVYLMTTNGFLNVLNAANGSFIWGLAPPSFGFEGLSTPAVANGNVYFSEIDLNVSPVESLVYAYNTTTHNAAWSVTDVAVGQVFAGLAVNSTALYFATDIGSFYSVNAATGSFIWGDQLGTKGEIIRAPLVANGSLYLGATDSFVYAVNASSGSLLWVFQSGSVVDVTPAYDPSSGTVYFGSLDSVFYAVSASTGNAVWTFDTGGGVESSAVFFLDNATGQSNVYFGDDNGKIFALSGGTGSLLWTYGATNAVFSDTTVA